jgi:catechol-2,3-dioxygenase
MSTGAKLRNIILLVKDIEVSAHFYQSAIGVAVLGKGENIIQLDSGGTSIILKVC